MTVSVTVSRRYFSLGWRSVQLHNIQIDIRRTKLKLNNPIILLSKQLNYHEIHFPYDPMAGFIVQLKDMTDGAHFQCRSGELRQDIEVVESGE